MLQGYLQALASHGLHGHARHGLHGHRDRHGLHHHGHRGHHGLHHHGHRGHHGHFLGIRGCVPHHLREVRQRLLHAQQACGNHHLQ